MKTLIETVRKDLRLSEKRMRHTEGVIRAAKLLAERHFPGEITPEEAELASLLHDYTKEYSEEEHLAVFARYGVEVTPAELKPHKLLHARTAALIAEHAYHAPEEVCSAVRWHTTGRPAMRPLELVIYFADYIEDGRTHPSCVHLRDYYEKEYRARKDGMRALQLAMVRSFDATLRSLIAEKKVVDEYTVRARNYYLKLAKGGS
ncbi:MAG: bis(5'-nucleosyl)-tetraphosphatase (symmetrical) YqeK [Oscillospiraceae bacterium]|nr:bis(5'-nucleosyl)-tetraphosphatase (symmetrical) YqeK [Oscillospiraceae bacterium]